MSAAALRSAALLLAALLLPPAATGDNAATATAPAPDAAASRPDLRWELDPYYSSVALELPLTAAPVPDGGHLPEPEVYTQLFRDSLRPRLLMLEASVYPLPAAGTWLRRHQPGTYEDYRVGTLGDNELNLIDAVTAGFQEPWALSVFTGSVMQFSVPGQPAAQRNRGYMGYLVSAGAKHIRNNRLIDDDWWELEWKLKGERELGDEELSWSFRLGLKTHGNPDISDVGYVALRRSNLDYASPWLSLLRNSDMSLLTELDRRNGHLLRQEAVVGRKLPLRRYRIALTLEVGAIYEAPEKYRGALADPTADELTFVLRPRINF
jgi:hypothetical protein